MEGEQALKLRERTAPALKLVSIEDDRERSCFIPPMELREILDAGFGLLVQVETPGPYRVVIRQATA